MTPDYRSHRLLTALSAAALLSVALPTGAMAQKVKTPTPAATETPMAAPEMSLEIPTIDVENSTLDADQLREILEGSLADYADELAGLTADRISIPEVRFAYMMPGDEIESEFIYSDIEVLNVVDGVAEAVTIGTTTMTTMDDVAGEFGAMTAADFNIRAALGFYGMVDTGAEGGFEVVYRDLEFAGGTFGSDEFSCEIGAAYAAEFSARPLNTSFVEFMEMANEMEAAGDAPPDPETVREFLGVYADLLTAFSSSESSFDGLTCSGTDEDGATFDVAMGEVLVGAFEPGRYPALTLNDLSVDIDGGPEAGSVSMGQFVIKGFDYSAQVEFLNNLPDDVLDETWAAANWRQFIPAFEGFSFEAVELDVPDPEGGPRIVGSVGAFDLTLGNYINAVPADISSSADNLYFELPTDSDDEQIAMMRALGIETLDLGYDLAMRYDEASETIAVDSLAVEGADLGSIMIAGTLANAVTELFDADPNIAAAAGLGLTVTDLSVDVADYGMIDILMTVAGAEQGATAQQMRPMMAGVAEGMAMGLLGGNEMATQVGQAIGAFLRSGGNLNLEITAKDPEGIGMTQFMAAEEDPAVLLNQVDISATNE
jgi:hypothetical protein